MESRFVRKQKEAGSITSFFFIKPTAFVFDAGDFTELAFDFPGGSGDKRWFTVASAPQEKEIQITMKFPPKPSKFKQQLNKLELGYAVMLSPALGKFNLPRDKAEPLLFVAGGVGITPFRSILSHLELSNERRDINLIYVANEGEHIFKTVLDKSCADIQYEISGFDLQSLDVGDKTIYLSGPEPMMKQYFETLLASGVHRSKIMLDYFPGYTRL